MNGFDERLEFQIPALSARRMKILAHAFAEIAGFAHVNDRAEAILVQIHTRLVGQLAEFLADRLGHGHKGKLGRQVPSSKF